MAFTYCGMTPRNEMGCEFRSPRKNSAVYGKEEVKGANGTRNELISVNDFETGSVISSTMLRIIAQTSSAAARSYYSTADYFTEGQELQGAWRGQGATMLGLSGTVQQSDWDALCENLDPRTGQQLTARRNDQRRVGWDFNFSVPKSASILYALTQDERILHAFEKSVDQTMADIESELQTRVRTGRKNTDRVTGNGVWGRFVHFTSRPVDGVPDPQLHAHCFLFNSTFDETENRWKAAQIGSIKRDGNYFNALMHSRFAAKLTAMGVPIERTAKAWQIAGLDESTQQKFSRRTQQIEQAAERMGITDPDEKAALGAITRDGKNKKLSMDELRAEWLSWLTPDESGSVHQLQTNLHDPMQVTFDPTVAKAAIDYAADHHFERESVIPERTLLTTALHHAVGRANPDQVLGAEYGSDLIVGSDNGRRMITSPAVLAEEQRMLAFTKSGRNVCDALITEQSVDAPDWFNPGQRKALNHLLKNRDRVMVLRGVAGAGKTSLLTELKKQAESRGRQIFAFAPSTDASRGVLRESGFDNAETLTTLLVSPKAQESVRDQIILVDEAGQVGSKSMAKLFDIAQKQNARIILSGDRYQHGSVERGSALRLLEQEAGLKSAQLTDIVRQREQYRQAVAYLSQGRVEAGFNVLDNLKWVHEIHDPEQRYDRIAAEYIQSTEAGKSVLVVSPTHSESAKVTQAIRSTLKHECKIGSDKAIVLKLTNRNLTLAERQDAVHFADGDVVVFTQNAKGFQKGTRLTVGTDAIPLNLADRFSVYRASEIAVAEGDIIRITANAPTADGHRVNNGQTFTVTSIASDGTLTLNNGWHIGPKFGQLDYGYCGTSHASQGKTKDKVIVAQSSESFPAASREQLYVSASRGRTQCSVYTDDKQGLLDAVTDSSDRLTATELASTMLIRSRVHEQERIDRQPIHLPETTRYAERGA